MRTVTDKNIIYRVPGIFLNEIGFKFAGPDQESIYKDIIDRAREGDRVSLICGGIRAGKSRLEAALGSSLSWVGDFAREVWITAISYDMTKAEYHYMLQDYQTYEIKKNRALIPPGGYAWTSRDKSYIRLGHGKEINTKSLRDMEKVAAFSPGVILVCEADQVPYDTILRCIERLTESEGVLILGGTFESSLGWMAEKYKEWQQPNSLGAKSYSLPSWTNKIIFPLGRKDPKIKFAEDNLPADVFNERYGGVPSKPSGLVVKEFSYKHHVKEVEYDPDYAVEIWVDPGYAGAYAVLFIQVKHDTVYVIDEVYERMIFDDVYRLCQYKPFWSKVRTGVIDIAGSQHHGDVPQAERWKNVGVRLQARKADLDASVERTRSWFKVDPITEVPHVIISPKCIGLLSELGGAKPKWENAGPWMYKMSSDKTIIGFEDRNNHALSALRYGIILRFGYTREALAVASGQDRWYKW